MKKNVPKRLFFVTFIKFYFTCPLELLIDLFRAIGQPLMSNNVNMLYELYQKENQFYFWSIDDIKLEHQ
jgi:hypothetical protein